MKYQQYAILLAILLSSCGGTTSVKEESVALESTEQAIPEEQEVPVETVSQENIQAAEYTLENVTVPAVIEENYSSVPFYVDFEGKKFFVTCSGDCNSPFTPKNGYYGLVAEDGTELLMDEYDKIYNINQIALNCVEFKSGQVGLLNLKTGKFIGNDFDFFIPSGKEVSHIAYGSKEGQWFRVDVRDIENAVPVSLTKQEIANAFEYDALHTGIAYQALTYSSDGGNGIVLVPSFIERLELMEDHFDDVVLKMRDEVYGITNAEVSVTKEKSISDRIYAFLTSIYKEGIDARGYVNENQKLVVYDGNNASFSSQVLEEDYYDHSNPCSNRTYKFLNDSILEVMVNKDYRSDILPYYFQPHYKFFLIDRAGKITNLDSDRFFDFTKFVEIDESYFQGCYAISDKMEDDGTNMIVHDHLTIEELDIMRNEIFAEYGYKFKTEKWNTFFSKLGWYKPRYDNVDDQLTPIDKANIKTILKVKEAMQGNEEKFVNEHRSAYVPAG